MSKPRIDQAQLVAARAKYPAHLQAQLKVSMRALENCGYESLLIHSGALQDYFLDDRQVPFKVNPHYAWLVPEHGEHCALLIELGKMPQLLLHQPLDFWHATPAAPATWWADQFQIKQHEQHSGWLDAIEDHSRLAVIGDDPILEKRFQNAAINPVKLLHQLHLGRTVKSGWEISCLRGACHIAATAHQAVAAALHPGQSEFDLHLVYQQAARQCELELPYDNIVALNEHAAVLHFTALEKQPPPQLHALLIDAGAQMHGYAADITRSYSTAKNDLYADLITGVDALQLQLVNQARVGIDYRDLHVQAHHLIAALLQQLDVVRMSVDEQLQHGVTSAFFPHGLGHYLGLQVHDVAGLVDDQGEFIARPSGHPFLRLTRKLAAGNVLTIEPGVYIIDQLLQPLLDKHPAAFNMAAIHALRPCGGVRIEDDVLITEAGPVNLSRAAFAAL